tara:strand:- start:275 stop:499 length:225 start_codon:yes stop_codon:yes gene_type:complete
MGNIIQRSIFPIYPETDSDDSIEDDDIQPIKPPEVMIRNDLITEEKDAINKVQMKKRNINTPNNKEILENLARY